MLLLYKLKKLIPAGAPAVSSNMPERIGKQVRFLYGPAAVKKERLLYSTVSYDMGRKKLCGFQSQKTCLLVGTAVCHGV